MEADGGSPTPSEAPSEAPSAAASIESSLFPTEESQPYSFPSEESERDNSIHFPTEENEVQNFGGSGQSGVECDGDAGFGGSADSEPEPAGMLGNASSFLDYYFTGGGPSTPFAAAPDADGEVQMDLFDGDWGANNFNDSSRGSFHL
jgi:hypothetical protein